MVKMGNVWDRTVDVLGGRSGMIAPIALFGLFLPSVVSNGVVALSTPGAASFKLIGAVLAIAALVVTIWAQLAIIAIATDPATDAAAARRQAAARLGPAIGIALLMVIVVSLFLVPPVVVLIRSGFDFAAAGGTTVQMTPPSANAVAFVGLYGLAFLIALLWVGTRLALLNPVILNERRGIGALRRSIRLTAGLTWRIIGVVILFLVVLIVSTWAAQSVTGVVFRLVLGADHIPLVTFLAGAAGSLVSTVFTALAAVFTAQLYVATAGASTSE